MVVCVEVVYTVFNLAFNCFLFNPIYIFLYFFVEVQIVYIFREKEAVRCPFVRFDRPIMHDLYHSTTY